MVGASLISDLQSLNNALIAAAPLNTQRQILIEALQEQGADLLTQIDDAVSDDVALDAADPTGFPGDMVAALLGLSDASDVTACDMRGLVGRAMFNLGQLGPAAPATPTVISAAGSVTFAALPSGGGGGVIDAGFDLLGDDGLPLLGDDGNPILTDGGASAGTGFDLLGDDGLPLLGDDGAPILTDGGTTVTNAMLADDGTPILGDDNSPILTQ